MPCLFITFWFISVGVSGIKAYNIVITQEWREYFNFLLSDSRLSMKESSSLSGYALRLERRSIHFDIHSSHGVVSSSWMWLWLFFIFVPFPLSRLLNYKGMAVVVYTRIRDPWRRRGFSSFLDFSKQFNLQVYTLHSLCPYYHSFLLNMKILLIKYVFYISVFSLYHTLCNCRAKYIFLFTWFIFRFSCSLVQTTGEAVLEQLLSC